AFDLRLAAPELPDHDVPGDHTEMTWLRELTMRGARVRYPSTHPKHAEAMAQIAHELDVIEQLNFPGYFLVLVDIVEFCRIHDIYCQGRGSAANSAVCYALGVTKADAVELGLLFERFLSLERDGPPDIDLDIEHQRREEVIQYVYGKYGRERAAQVANVITYRPRSALREMAKAVGLSPGHADALTKWIDRWGRDGGSFEGLRDGADAGAPPVPKLALELAEQVLDFPRHLGIHSGGMVMADRPLTECCPIEWARMENRSVLQWDKDDCAAAGLVKFDLLGLGMLTMLHLAVDLVRDHEGVDVDLATIPQEPEVYALLSAADTIGVFQVESRAQMNLLPRMKPKSFYDLTIEIALIRPGPILGDMVHPFLRRREGLEEVTYPSDEVKRILEKTLGVPLFQEQAMRLAVTAAGFNQGEADALRRALSHKRAEVLLVPWRERFVNGCVGRGYGREYAERCFEQFKGFSHYGFPESHSASFALIAYASAYVKCYHPAAFAAALLNSQPMGFYAPHTIVEDAKRHGVVVRPIDVRHSNWDATLEDGAMRVGLREVKGLQETHARVLVEARGTDGFGDLGDLARRVRIPRHALERLARAGALDGLCGSRRQAMWEVQALGPSVDDDLFRGMPMDRSTAPGRPLGEVERV
ncbi:MAG TPA: error-prone DNA polymerase, partial [Solirubrobacteraceae bacterium]